MTHSRSFVNIPSIMHSIKTWHFLPNVCIKECPEQLHSSVTVDLLPEANHYYTAVLPVHFTTLSVGQIGMLSSL